MVSAPIFSGAIFDSSFGRDNPMRVHPLSGLAGDLSALGEHAEAERLYREALALAEKSFPPGHPLLLRARGELETELRSVGRGEEADALAQAANATELASSASSGEPLAAAAEP